jgi:hypothetical protein
MAAGVARMPVLNPSLQRLPMAAPYQPSLLRVLHGTSAVLVAIGWITGLLLLAFSVPLHLFGAVRRGGWPLAASMLSLQLRTHDGPLHWPGQLLRYVRRGR